LTLLDLQRYRISIGASILSVLCVEGGEPTVAYCPVLRLLLGGVVRIRYNVVYLHITTQAQHRTHTNQGSFSDQSYNYTSPLRTNNEINSQYSKVKAFSKGIPRDY
jgi:hypothetical protein